MAALLADEEVPESIEGHAGGAARQGHGSGGQAVGRRLGATPGDPRPATRLIVASTKVDEAARGPPRPTVAAFICSMDIL
jgi:hypothetical protein